MDFGELAQFDANPNWPIATRFAENYRLEFGGARDFEFPLWDTRLKLCYFRLDPTGLRFIVPTVNT